MLSIFVLFIYPIGLINVNKRKRERGKEREEVSKLLASNKVRR